MNQTQRVGGAPNAPVKPNTAIGSGVRPKPLMPAKTTTSKQSSDATNSQIMIPDASFNATGSKDKRLTMLPD